MFENLKISFFILSISIFVNFCLAQESKDFDDSVLYKIDFPGIGGGLTNFNPDKFEDMIITTPDLENYRCVIPITEKQTDEQKEMNSSLSPLHFVKAIFNSQACSYRIEAYWSYEICHGNYIKQYHDERDGKALKTQEYYLGKWSEDKSKQLEEKLKEDLEQGRKFKTTKIDNVNYPYLELEMNDGTLCDLNGETRVTKVRYICYPHGKNEIYTLKEVSSCNYEAVVLTSTLCMHNSFVPEESKENLISCLPQNDAPDKPLSWLKNELDNLEYRNKQQSPLTSLTDISALFDKNKKKNVAIIKINEKDGTVRMDFIDTLNFDEQISQLEKLEAAINELENAERQSLDSTENDSKKPATFLSKKPTDNTPIKEFLAGKNCLTGGNSWWRYEFCYGRYVRQFHMEKNSETSSLLLGRFNEQLHKQWLINNPEKRPQEKSNRNQISHFYQGGSVCDKTGEKRQTEVKLKCVQNSSGLSQVSMYLLEPKICQYILVVESALICDVLKIVNKDALVDAEEFDKLLEPTDKTSQSSGQTIVF